MSNSVNPPRIMFLRDKKGFAVGCLAIDVNRIKHQVAYQLSVHDGTDTFNRALARQIAIGRLIESPVFVKIPPHANMTDITWAVMTDIVDWSKHAPVNHTPPNRAVKAAKLWLSKVKEEF
jgi:hypothetical protein